MTPVFRPILRTSIRSLLNAPSAILFGVVIALFGILRQPFFAAGWPNVWTRLATEEWVTSFDTSNIFAGQTTFSWTTAIPQLMTIARTDPWGFFGLSIVFGGALIALLILLFLLPRSIAALIETGHAFRTKERYTLATVWRRGKRAWGTITILLLVAQLVPWGIDALLQIFAPAATTQRSIIVALITMLTTALAIYASIYRVVGDYQLGEAMIAGAQRLLTRLGTTIECTLLMIGTDVVGLALLSIIGAIAIVPFLLLLVIFWTLQWGTLFAWVTTLLFILLTLYTLCSFATIIAFNYLVWVNLFYTYESIEQTSFTTRSFHVIRAWIKNRK